MSNFYYKVKLYLEANGKNKSEIDLDGNVQLKNEGSGDYISVWNVSGVAKPSDSQLNALDSNATKELNNAGVRNTRRAAYGDIGEQLDLLYKDMLADKGDKTGEWFKKIKAVKDANAKEE